MQESKESDKFFIDGFQRYDLCLGDTLFGGPHYTFIIF